MFRNFTPTAGRAFSPQRRVFPMSHMRASPAKGMVRMQSQSNFQSQPRQHVIANTPRANPVEHTYPQRGSSFLTYPKHLNQQQIQNTRIGLAHRRAVPDPNLAVSNLKQPPPEPQYSQNIPYLVTSTSSIHTGITTDQDFDLLLKKEPAIVYCPVCESNYSTGALQQHIQKHKELDQILSRQVAQQSKISHRQSTLLSKAGLSSQKINIPVIIEPEEFVVADDPPQINNLFVVNSSQNRVSVAQQPLMRNIERVPLQNSIEMVNFYSCFDGVVNHDESFSYGDTCRMNECITRPRELTSWETGNIQRF